MPPADADADAWLADLGGDKDGDVQQQVAAALAMIDDFESAYDSNNSSPSSLVESTASSSVADCTDVGSKDDNGSSRSPSPEPLRSAQSGVEVQDKAAHRIAKKNQARLRRYHCSKAELAGLRQETTRLQKQLRSLQRMEEAFHPVTLASSPCPFVEDQHDELDPNEIDRPLMASTSASRCKVRWEDVAYHERRRLQRSQAVRRKLKRLLQEFESGAKQLPLGLDKRMLPSLPGADSLEAFTLSGMAMMSELYRMACDAYSVPPATTVELSKSGSGLAYSFLLGDAIEAGWTHDFSYPGDDPSRIAALMVRMIRSQQPQRYVVRETLKDHDTKHPLAERRFTMRHQGASGAPVELECAMLMQTFNADGATVVVWTLSVHSGDSSAPPVFRASGWSALQQSSPGQVTCQSRAQVHCTQSQSLARVEKVVKRQPMIDSWSTAIRKKQDVMSNRMLLVL